MWDEPEMGVQVGRGGAGAFGSQELTQSQTSEVKGKKAASQGP